MPYTLIAEVGCNHKGDLDIAKRFIEVATSFCEVTHVKFQKRSVRDLLTDDEYSRPHPVPHNAYGATYGEHREALEFSADQHRELKEYCDEKGAVYSCSVWDLTSLREIVALRPAYIKIPSALNTHCELLERACDECEAPIHVAVGMTTRAEEEQLIEIFRAAGRLRDLVLYACTSGYPVEAPEVCLLEISRLQAAYGTEVGGIGFSGHHNGISLDIAAATLGAAWIERHFTLNRTWKGTDHAASLEPDGLRRLSRNLIQLEEALTYKPQEILPVEIEQRQKLKKFQRRCPDPAESRRTPA
ncbi:MAG: N-acetylneuraminate synthase family protein [Vicinamibacterales bacterium]